MIRQKTPQAEIDSYLEQRLSNLEIRMVENMQYVGERCINEARSNGSYKDRTGNLRSSVGYVVVNSGNIVQSGDFRREGGGTEGSASGRAFAESLVDEFPTGIVLIIVAGMNYASAVASKGYDVLDSAELLAEKLVPELMLKLGFTRQ